MGKLFIVSTPIGNLEDITIRAIKTLLRVDIIACEDTRHTGLLVSELSKRYPQFVTPSQKPQLIAYHDHNEESKTFELVELLRSGKTIALVSDAGTPLISDPGFRLVRECIRQGIAVISIPGPTSIIAALTSSGLPPDNFWFLGFLPPKQSKRKEKFTSMLRCFESSKYTSTVVFLEAPHRLQESLADLMSVFGDIEIVVTRELTKVHEEIWRGTISDALPHFPTPRGEYVILFHPKDVA